MAAREVVTIWPSIDQLRARFPYPILVSSATVYRGEARRRGRRACGRAGSHNRATIGPLRTRPAGFGLRLSRRPRALGNTGRRNRPRAAMSHRPCTQLPQPSAGRLSAAACRWSPRCLTRRNIERLRGRRRPGDVAGGCRPLPAAVLRRRHRVRGRERPTLGPCRTQALVWCHEPGRGRQHAYPSPFFAAAQRELQIRDGRRRPHLRLRPHLPRFRRDLEDGGPARYGRRQMEQHPGPGSDALAPPVKWATDPHTAGPTCSSPSSL